MGTVHVAHNAMTIRGKRMGGSVARGNMDDFALQRRKFNLEVAKMTNWQRHQWAKEGAPGLAAKDIGEVRRFIFNLSHLKEERGLQE